MITILIKILVNKLAYIIYVYVMILYNSFILTLTLNNYKYKLNMKLRLILLLALTITAIYTSAHLTCKLTIIQNNGNTDTLNRKISKL
jgi:hypothetical protein